MRALECAVRHETRLDILGSLDYAGPLAAEDLSARIGKTLTETGYHAAILTAHGLVSVADGNVYEVAADQPDWVREAVEAHRLARRIALSAGLPFAFMAGMKCDYCDRLLQYKSEVVAVYEIDGVREAKLVIEDTPGMGEAGASNPLAKYHRRCYDDARAGDSSLPVLS